jgi:hypothetical protein
MGHLDGGALAGKVLLLNLACGHTRIVERVDVSTVVKGNVAMCEKCHWAERRILQREWVRAKERAR